METLYISRNSVITLFNDKSSMLSEAEFNDKGHDKGLKILTSKKIL